MISDYSTRYYSSIQHRRLKHAGPWIPTKKIAGLFRQPLLRKTAGIMVALTLVTGLTSTFWYSRQINSALDEIGNNRQLHHELMVENRQLISARQTLLTRENIVAEARKLGLHPPTKKQLHRL